MERGDRKKDKQLEVLVLVHTPPCPGSSGVSRIEQRSVKKHKIVGLQLVSGPPAR